MGSTDLDLRYSFVHTDGSPKNTIKITTHQGLTPLSGIAPVQLNLRTQVMVCDNDHVQATSRSLSLRPWGRLANGLEERDRTSRHGSI